MPDAAIVDQVQGESEARPYAPGWVDRFTARIGQLPGPSWSYYVGAGLALFLAQTAVLWGERAYPVGTLVPAHIFIATLIPAFLALLHYLDHRAGQALTTLRPALKTTEREYRELCYRLTTLPARPTLLASFAGALFVVATTELLGAPSSYQAIASSPVSAGLMYAMYIVTWWIAGAFMYHTAHQLSVINRIYIEHTNIDLWRMRPLYAFSSLTATTAVSLTASTYGWLALNPGLLGDPTAMALVLPITCLALAAFVWPLLGVHKLLVEEKERLLDECSLRLEATIAELHRRVDSGRLEGMDDLNRAIASLEVELNLLERTPTWPWQPETVRLLVTALALPLGLWVAQYILQLLIGS